MSEILRRVIVPKSDIEGLERARRLLHEVITEIDGEHDDNILVKLSLKRVTSELYRVTHSKYKEL